jgi:hypothetical protein
MVTNCWKSDGLRLANSDAGKELTGVVVPLVLVLFVLVVVLVLPVLVLVFMLVVVAVPETVTAWVTLAVLPYVSFTLMVI